MKKIPSILFLIIICSVWLNAKPINSDLKLWYTRSASEWLQALPVGNGSLGGMIFGGVEQEHIQFNEESLVAGTSFLNDWRKDFKGVHPHDALTKRLADASGKSFQQLRKNHISDYRELFDRVSLNLGMAPDQPLEERETGVVYIEILFEQ